MSVADGWKGLTMSQTNKALTRQFADFLRIENGQAGEHWGITDTGALMEQLTGG